MRAKIKQWYENNFRWPYHYYVTYRYENGEGDIFIRSSHKINSEKSIQTTKETIEANNKSKGSLLLGVPIITNITRIKR